MNRYNKVKKIYIQHSGFRLFNDQSGTQKSLYILQSIPYQAIRRYRQIYVICGKVPRENNTSMNALSVLLHVRNWNKNYWDNNNGHTPMAIRLDKNEFIKFSASWVLSFIVYEDKNALCLSHMETRKIVDKTLHLYGAPFYYF